MIIGNSHIDSTVKLRCDRCGAMSPPCDVWPTSGAIATPEGWTQEGERVSARETIMRDICPSCTESTGRG